LLFGCSTSKGLPFSREQQLCPDKLDHKLKYDTFLDYYLPEPA
jgi:hypothetical protein